MFQGQMRPKIGCPTVFPPEIEADFALYLKHCALLRIPCSRKLFKGDVLHFTQYKELTFPKMPEDGPGMAIFVQQWCLHGRGGRVSPSLLQLCLKVYMYFIRLTRSLQFQGTIYLCFPANN